MFSGLPTQARPAFWCSGYFSKVVKQQERLFSVVSTAVQKVGTSWGWTHGSSGQDSCCRGHWGLMWKSASTLNSPHPSPPPWPWNGPSSAWEHLRLIHLDPSVRKVHFRPSLTFPGGKLAVTSQSVCDISIKRGVTKAEPLTFGAVHQW